MLSKDQKRVQSLTIMRTFKMGHRREQVRAVNNFQAMTVLKINHVWLSFNLVFLNILPKFLFAKSGLHLQSLPLDEKLYKLGHFHFTDRKAESPMNWIFFFCCYRSCNKSVLEQKTELRVSCALDKNSCLQSRLSLCSSNELLHCFVMCHMPPSTCPSRLLQVPGHCATVQCQNVTIILAGDDNRDASQGMRNITSFVMQHTDSIIFHISIQKRCFRMT